MCVLLGMMFFTVFYNVADLGNIVNRSTVEITSRMNYTRTGGVSFEGQSTSSDGSERRQRIQNQICSLTFSSKITVFCLNFGN